MRSLSCGVALLAAVLSASLSAQSQRRPTIGLALGGGSARGLSHVGILEWLHEHRIPVDYVAGTSMGGLVGGAFASGMPPDEIRARLGSVDWDRMFLGEPPYRQREFRRKEDRRQFPVGIEAGLKDGFRLPSGLDPAHQVGLFLSYIAFPYTSDLNFDDLPTPFRAVATNMDAADVRVLDRGSLAQALLATMALPGIFPAVQIDGTTLADGGLLNNVPADVVRAMGADIVIAIDVSNRETDEHIDALSQAGRAIDVMMENATRRALVDADLVIRPDLEGFGSLDWRRSDALADHGYEAAEAISSELLQYTVSEAEWDAWRRARGARTRDKAFVPTSLRVRGTTPALEELILERLAENGGAKIDHSAAV